METYYQRDLVRLLRAVRYNLESANYALIASEGLFELGEFNDSVKDVGMILCEIDGLVDRVRTLEDIVKEGS